MDQLVLVKRKVSIVALTKIHQVMKSSIELEVQIAIRNQLKRDRHLMTNNQENLTHRILTEKKDLILENEYAD